MNTLTFSGSTPSRTVVEVVSLAVACVIGRSLAISAANCSGWPVIVSVPDSGWLASTAPRC